MTEGRGGEKREGEGSGQEGREDKGEPRVFPQLQICHYTTVLQIHSSSSHTHHQSNEHPIPSDTRFCSRFSLQAHSI